MSRLDAHERLLKRLEGQIASRQPSSDYDVPSLHTFLKEAWHVLEPATPFVDGWHLQCIAEHLEAVTGGLIRRLLINVPPRHSKSSLAVIWTVWTWLLNPSVQWLCASYSLGLALRDNRKARLLIQSPYFQAKYGSAFHLSDDQSAKSLFENSARGYRMAVSVGSGSTGMNASIGLVDDLHSISDRDSKTAIEAATDWFDTVFSTRLNDPAKGGLVVIGQRVHESDISGHLLSQGGWEHLCLPAEYSPTRRCYTPTLRWSDPRREEGELLWPERFSRATLEQQRRNLGAVAYSALYEQSPTPAGGAIFKKEWLRYFGTMDEAYMLVQPNGTRAVLKSSCTVFATVDLAISSKQTADYTVIGVWGVTPERDLLLVDLIRGRFDFAESQRQIEMVYLRYRPDFIKVESVAFQLSMVQTLLARGIPVREYRPTRDKVSRASAASIWFENGKCYLDARASWLPDVEGEMVTFPKGSHDDVVDNVSMACDEVLMDDGDIPFCVTHTAVSSPIRGLLPRTYVPEPGEVDDEETARLEASQRRVSNFMQQLGLGRRW